MIIAWAISLISGFMDTLMTALPSGSGSSSGVMSQGPVVNFLVNIGYYVDLVPMIYVFSSVALVFIGFLAWKVLLMIYNLIPFLR